MVLEKTWRWVFLAFESQAEGNPVQNWFDRLPEEDRYEITDLLDNLQKVNDRLWPKEVYNALRGEGGISEIRIPNLKRFRDGRVQIITYRIYGFFGPFQQCYTFLHGTTKDVKNDREGKKIAKQRLDRLRAGLGTGAVSIRKLAFEGGADS